MRVGSNIDTMTILRRAVDPTDDRGDFVVVGTTWASWTQAAGKQITDAGQIQDDIDLTVSLNDSPANRQITSSDRAILRGVQYAIVSVGLPEDRGLKIPIALRREIAG